MKRCTLTLLGLCLAHWVFAQASFMTVSPHDTDSLIDQGNIDHHIYIPTASTAQGKCFVFFPGTNASPDMYDEIVQTAAEEGYHAIGLAYPNGTSISSLCSTDSDSLCSEKARTEIITGEDLHPTIMVDEHNCIENRLLRLLQYLHTNYQNYGWDDFFTGDSLNWDKIAFSGHSQGGGHAALVARAHVVNRVLFFNSPTDKQDVYGLPSWISPEHLTPASRYYAFFHQQNLGPRRIEVYTLFGMMAWGNEVNADITPSPYNGGHVLYSDTSTFDHNAYVNQSGWNEHSDIIVDHELPIDVNSETPYKVVWQYMLTHEETTALEPLAFEELGKVYPNPCYASLKIEVETAGSKQYALYTIEGELLMQGKFDEPFMDLSVEELPKGLYLLTLQSDKGYASVRFLKGE